MRVPSPVCLVVLNNQVKEENVNSNHLFSQKWYILDQVQESPEGTKELHEELAQLPIIVPPSQWNLRCHFHWNLHLIERRKSAESWITHGSVRDPGTTQKWTAAELKSLSGTTLNNTNNGNYSHWPDLWAVHTAIPFVGKEKCPYMWLCTEPWEVVNGLIGREYHCTKVYWFSSNYQPTYEPWV